MSSHKNDWVLPELALPAMSCLLYRRVSRIKNAIKWEWMSLRNLYKCKQFVYYFVVLCHTQSVFTQDWLNFFWIAVACSVLPFIPQDSSLKNALKWECLCVISINVNNLFIILLFILFTLSLQCCCCLFTCLSPSFYTDVVSIFVFIRWSCFWNFCLSF